MYRRGDIVWVDFPFTDLTKAKKRPALVLSNNDVNSTGDYIMVMITSKGKSDNLSIALGDADYLESPLELESFVRVHKVFTSNKTIMHFKETSVTDEFCNYVLNKLNTLITPDHLGMLNVNAGK